MSRATWALAIETLRALNFFSGPDLFLLISFIHQVLEWANIFKGHLGLGLHIWWALTKFWGQSGWRLDLIWPLIIVQVNWLSLSWLSLSPCIYKRSYQKYWSCIESSNHLLMSNWVSLTTPNMYITVCQFCIGFCSCRLNMSRLFV